MFSGLKFRGKLAVGIVPALIALAVLAWATVAPRLQVSSDASDDLRRIAVASDTMEVFDELEFELGLSARTIVNRALTAELVEQRAVVDKRVEAMRRPLEQTAGDSGLVLATLRFLDSLPTLRGLVDDTTIWTDVGVSTLVAKYDKGMSALIDSIRVLTTATDNAELLRTSQLLDIQLTGKEHLAEAYALVGGHLEGGQVDPDDSIEVADVAAKAAASYAQFEKITGRAELQKLRTVQADPSVASITKQLEVIRANAAEGKATTAAAADWSATATAALIAYDTLDDGLFVDYEAKATDIKTSSRQAAILYLLLAGLAGLAAAGIAYIVGRNLVRRVKQISDDAHTIAFDRLPEVLETLRNPTPEALAGAIPQVTAPSKDEIGSLAESFNTVLRTSVETSIEHSTRRAETLTNLLINLGRRNQSIIERQLQLIDSLESRQQDPDLLEGLFKLDHMVTRQRRNAESLLVLAGSRRSRGWTAPVPLSDVISGAVSEISEMGRVSVEMPPGHDLLVAGQYAVDLSHMLAELVENATLYSSPSTQVVVRGQRNGMNVRLWVIDNGVGMTDDELESANQRVSDPPDIDELTTDQVGFQVVGRLGLRLTARIRLQNNPAGGLAVSVDLHPNVFEPMHDDQSVAAAAEAETRRAIDEPLQAPAEQDFDFDLEPLSADDDFDFDFGQPSYAESAVEATPLPQRSTRPADESAPSGLPRRGSTAPADLPRRQPAPANAAAAPDSIGQAEMAPTPLFDDATNQRRRTATVEQTPAGLAKRQPGAAVGRQRPPEDTTFFGAESAPTDEEAAAEARLRAMRAFSRGVDQGRENG